MNTKTPLAEVNNLGNDVVVSILDTNSERGKYLFDLIQNGESETVEFKTRVIDDNQIASILTAFANTQGGYLFVGVKDNGEILGLSNEETSLYRKRIYNICNSLFSYPYEIEIVNLKGRNIIVVKIDKAPSHLYPLTTANGNTYLKAKAKLKKFTISSRDDYKIKLDIHQGDNKTSKEIVGFIAMSFRTEQEPALIDYYNAMLRAAQKTGCPIKLYTMIQQSGDYEISKQIMEEIEKSDFVIGDFTLNSHNVYFEVGYARGAKKRIIQVCRKGTLPFLEFDVRNWKTLEYRNATELELKLVPILVDVYFQIVENS